MNRVLMSLLVLLICLGFSKDIKGQCADVVVDINGSGDYTSIQEAIDAAPNDLDVPFIIYIKNGIYDEKLFIEKNFISLVGESREETVVTTAVLRRLWRENNPSDWGAATINIASDASDLLFSNMTIQNNFADVFPDTPTPNDHTFAIRGGGHRVIIVNCNVVTTGGDTLSLWNTNGGMFYHSHCFFEGYVDYVAPRGYCYITDSEFFGYNSNASIWHDGSGGEDHKLVIRRSHFDGVQGFALGRHHRDAAFYLLDCQFSDNMKTSQGIVRASSDDLMWGERYYYYNCHRNLIDFPWMYDNLDEAAGSPEEEEIDALWTFNGAWDPESLLDGAMPFVFFTAPKHASACVDVNVDLSWSAALCADSYVVRLESYAGDEWTFTTNAVTIDIPELEPGMEYTWRVNAIVSGDTITGAQRNFQTNTVTNEPYAVFNPEPPHAQDHFTNLLKLNWDYFSCNTDTFEVYVGFSPEAMELVSIQKYPGYFIHGPKDDSTYFWQIVSKGDGGSTDSPVWQFRLNPTVTSTKDYFGNEVKIDVSPNPAYDSTELLYEIDKSGQVRLEVFDLSGKLIAVPFEGRQMAGLQRIRVGRENGLTTGKYICILYYDGVLKGRTSFVIN